MKANVALPGPHQTLQLLEPVLYEDGLSPEPVSSMPTWELWSLPEMPWALLPRSGRWNGTNNVFSTAYWLPEGKFRRLRFCVLTPTPRSELVGLSSSPRDHSLCPAPMRVCSAGSFTVPEALTQIERAPRWHVSGLWY